MVCANYHEQLQDVWPSSLQEFIRQSVSMSLQRNQTAASDKERKSAKPSSDTASCAAVSHWGSLMGKLQGVSDKKCHEVVNMAYLVHCVAKQSQADVVVDAGSGLVCTSNTCFS